MSFIDCIEKAMDIEPKKKKELAKRYRDVEKMFLKRGSTADAALKAANYVANAEREAIEKRAINAKRQPIITQDAFNRFKADFDKRQAQWDEAYKKSPTMRALADNKLTGWLFLKPSMNREVAEHLDRASLLGDSYKNKALNIMEDALKYYKVTLIAGQPTKETREAVDKIWRAAGGEKFDDAGIMEAGAGVRKAMDWLTDEYIAAGGVMNKIENWMPQLHNAAILKEQGFDKWSAFVKPRLDWDRIKDHYGYPIPVDDQDKFLEEVFDTLSSGGMSKRAKAGEEGTTIMGKGSTANKRHHHRVLHFLSSADQLSYNKTFGVDDPFLAIVNHAESMSRDISIMKTMGPNPESFMNNIDSRMAREGGIDKFTQHMYKVAMGRTAATGAESGIYKFMKGTMAYLRSAQLTGAAIPALSDTIYAHQALKMAGLPTHGAMKDYFAGLSNAFGADNRSLKQIHALNIHAFELMMGNMHHAVFEGDTLLKGGKNWVDRYVAGGQNASSFVMTKSGLSHMTGTIKDAVSVSAFGSVGILKKLDWSAPELADFRLFMERASGMTEADWKIIQKAEAISVPGRDLPMVYPSMVAELNVTGALDASLKYDAVVNKLRRMAANEPDLRTKAVTTQGQESGSASRAVWDMLFMYRSFPITMVNNHFRNTLTEAYLKGGGMSAAADMAALIGMTTAGGYFILNAKDVINNRKPRILTRAPNITDAQQAMLQGGSLSLFGDLLLQDYTRFGQSFGMAVAGPVVSLVNDTYDLVRGDALDAMWGEDVLNFNESGDYGERFRLNASKYVQRYLPGASLWQIRGVMDAYVFDAIERNVGGSAYYDQKVREARNMRKLDQEKLFE